jgi:hypothetical protein
MRRPRLKDTTRPMRSGGRTALLAACLLALSGCGEGDSPGDTHGQGEEHAGHVIPAHKPKSYPNAVRGLRDLNDKISRSVVKGQPDADTLRVALDVATWLPEIAADSDMPEAQWNAVNSRSSALVEDYQELLKDNSGNARGVVEDANVKIGDLEQLLLASDPRWFAGAGRGAAPP